MRKEKPRRRRGFFFCEKPGRGGRKPGLSQRIKADCGQPMKTLGGVRQWPADNKFNSRLDWMFLACGAPFRYLRRERRSIIAWQACLSKGSPSPTHRPRPILPRRHRLLRAPCNRGSCHPLFDPGWSGRRAAGRQAACKERRRLWPWQSDHCRLQTGESSSGAKERMRLDVNHP